VVPLITEMATLAGVVLLDLVLTADSAAAVGYAAAALPPGQRSSAVVLGIGVALLVRIALAIGVIQLFTIKGLLFAGGLLTLWVAWRVWQDVQAGEGGAGAGTARSVPKPSFARVVGLIVIAEVSLSLDNVLAVAALARHSPAIMAFGMLLSVVLTGAAATFVAYVVAKSRWTAWAGIALIIFASAQMIWEGAHFFLPAIIPALPGTYSLD
jgi:YjbE family integral membrane protein